MEKNLEEAERLTELVERQKRTGQRARYREIYPDTLLPTPFGGPRVRLSQMEARLRDLRAEELRQGVAQAKPVDAPAREPGEPITINFVAQNNGSVTLMPNPIGKPLIAGLGVSAVAASECRVPLGG